MANFIQSNIDIPTQPSGIRIMTDSNGRLFVCYEKEAPSNELVVAYSDDSGVTWTEVAITAEGTLNKISTCIDSTDVIHIVYDVTGTGVVTYRTFSNLTFSATETVEDIINSHDFICISIDSSDIPHVCWINNSDTKLYYTNRSGGSWAGASILSSNSYDHTAMVIDNSNYIYILTRNSSSFDIVYFKYTNSWSGQNILDNGINSGPVEAVVDSNDNVYVVWKTSLVGPMYSKYTKATDSWSVSSEINLTTGTEPPNILSLSVLSNDNLFLFITDALNNLYYLTYNGSWSADQLLVDNVFPIGAISAYTPIYPKIGGISTQIATAGYQIVYVDTSSDDTAYYLSSDLTLQVPQDANYSSEANGSLPSDDSNLSSLFDSSEYSAVLTVDNIFATQSATDEYSIFEFKNRGNAISDNIVVTWIGQSNIAPSTSTVYLQIYNRDTTTWETLDSNSSSGANANFSLSGTKTSSLSSYYNGSLWVSCRVYQLAA